MQVLLSSVDSILTCDFMLKIRNENFISVSTRRLFPESQVFALEMKKNWNDWKLPLRKMKNFFDVFSLLLLFPVEKFFSTKTFQKLHKISSSSVCWAHPRRRPGTTQHDTFQVFSLSKNPFRADSQLHQIFSRFLLQHAAHRPDTVELEIKILRMEKPRWDSSEPWQPLNTPFTLFIAFTLALSHSNEIESILSVVHSSLFSPLLVILWRCHYFSSSSSSIRRFSITRIRLTSMQCNFS